MSPASGDVVPAARSPIATVPIVAAVATLEPYFAASRIGAPIARYRQAMREVAAAVRRCLQAAEIAERAGIALAIVNGTGCSPVAAALQSGLGTLFAPHRDATARQAWLGGGGVGGDKW